MATTEIRSLEGHPGGTVVKAAFERTLADAVALLRELPRSDRHAARAARSRFEQFKAAHAGLPCRLLVHTRPGSENLDFDILLTIEDAGSVALSWHPDDGVPWIASVADHWAANYVLTVNGDSTSIQSALLYLSARLQRRPDLMRDLVDRSLIFAAIGDAPPVVADAELEAAVDAFRRGQGLFSGAAMQRWLDEMHLTMETLEELVAQSLQLERFKDATVAAQVRPYFAAHRHNFERLTVVRLEGMTGPFAQRVAKAWRRSKTCPIFSAREGPADAPSGRIDTLFACDLPSEFVGKRAGTVVGPVSSSGKFSVGQVTRVGAARFDRVTRERIKSLLFESWLADQRSTAAIRWHWI
jgi:putative peptide maturation system protein